MYDSELQEQDINATSILVVASQTLGGCPLRSSNDLHIYTLPLINKQTGIPLLRSQPGHCQPLHPKHLVKSILFPVWIQLSASLRLEGTPSPSALQHRANTSANTAQKRERNTAAFTQKGFTTGNIKHEEFYSSRVWGQKATVHIITL